MKIGTSKGEITGQGGPRSPKTVQSAEGGEGRDKRERIICGCWKPLSGKCSCGCTRQRAQVSAGVGKPPHGLGGCIWMHPVNGTGNSPVCRTADPRSSQTGQVIRGLR